MVQLNGFVKIHRKLVRWGWYTDNVVKSLFLHFLLTANFKETEWMGRALQPGQLVTSYANLSAELRFSVRQIRTALDKLKSTGEITSEATNKFTVITVINWEDYQTFEEIATSEATGKKAGQRQTKDKRKTNERQTNDNSVRIQEDKKKRKRSGCAADAPSGQGDETESERLARITELRR